MSELTANTPMMKQYFAIKAENPGALIMFRLGDFYEFFGEDAKIASAELDIVLTGRDAGSEERMPMCGVPHHALDQYLSRLIAKGHKVCVCDQLEDPRLAKGIVKRGVTRVVTPGTAMDTQVRDESVFIAAVSVGPDNRKALAMCEVSTGKLRVMEFDGEDSLADLSGEITRTGPREILISENDYLSLSGYINIWVGDQRENSVITLRPASAFARENARARLDAQFGTLFGENESKPYIEHPLAGDCAGAILGYLDETQKALPNQIRELEWESGDDRLIMDITTFRNLEITKNLRTFEKKGSLLDLMDRTRTAFGARLLRGWLERPLADKNRIERRLDAVQSLYESWSLRQDLRDKLGKIYDMERLMTKVAYLRATPRDLLALKGSFELLPDISRTLGEIIESQSRGSGELSDILKRLDKLEDLHDTLSRAISEDIPGNWKEGGFIKAGYNREADEYVDNARNGRDRMLELERSEREKTGIKSLKIGYNKVFGYYFEVTKSNLSLVPDYFIRKQTLSTGERFVSEELTRLEGMVLGAEEKSVALELELFDELLAYLTKALPRVQASSNALATLDVFQSLAELAARENYCRPRILPAERSTVYIKDLRHPVVERILDESRFVPNDLNMDSDTSLFIITGPNMGGKSTFCRSAALAFVMAQVGSFVPAAKAEFPIRDQVFARVGASDDLRGGQSTFMMEMNEVARILSKATEKSLVILDEVGRGTGTYDGFSVAWAVSQYLVRKIKAKTLFATHFLELTELADIFPQVANLSIAVEEEGDKIVFLHKILKGSANKSYGVHVARLAGLPAEVIEDAGAKLRELEDKAPARLDLSLGAKPATMTESEPGALARTRPLPAPDITGYTINSLNPQMSLFGGGDDSSGAMEESAPANERNGSGKGLSGNELDVIKELSGKNLSKTTPLEALNFLNRLQRKLSKV